MGIEIPEALRRRRRHVLPLPCWRSRRCRASIRRSACSSTCRTRSSSTRCCAGARRTSSGRYLPRLARDTVGAYALSEAGSGSDAFALTTRATASGDGFVLDGRKLWITNAAEAGLFIVFATVDPAAGYKGITAFLVEREHARLHRRPQGRQARHPRQQHLRAAARGLPRAARATCSARSARATRSRSRRSTRAASASARRCSAWRRARSITPCATRRSASSSARRSPSSRACSSSSRAPPPTSRRRGCSSTTPRACATRGSRSSRKRRCASCSRRRSPSAPRRWPSICSAATAS